MFEVDKDFKRIGKLNYDRGKTFEKRVVSYVKDLKLSLMVKWIDRTFVRGVSKPDIEIIDFPAYNVDCKFTEGDFTALQKKQLLYEASKKYGYPTVCVYGERKGKTRLDLSQCTVGFYANDNQIFTMMYLDDWYRLLESWKLAKIGGV